MRAYLAVHKNSFPSCRGRSCDLSFIPQTFAYQGTLTISVHSARQGTYTSGNSEKACIRCPGDFYADKAGSGYCKRCPTDWLCLPGMAAQTPHR